MKPNREDRIKSGITKADWITSHVDEYIHLVAYNHAFSKDHPDKPYNKETIRTDNTGRYVGFLGELKVINDLFRKPNIIYSWKNFDPETKKPSYNYDLEASGYKLEIKTKDRSGPSELWYEASVAQNRNQKLQDCDFYIFTSISRNWHPDGDYEDCDITVLGYMSKEEFVEKSYLRSKGDFDPSNNFGTPKQCWNIFHDQLHPIAELLELIKSKQ